MQIETRTTQGHSSGLVIITADPQDREIRLTPDIAVAYRSVRVDSDLPVVVDPGATMFGLHAPRSDVSCAGDLTLRDLSAKSYRGDGHLYVLLRMGVEGDVLLSGELKGERHFPYEIGGDLVCDGVSVDGTVLVGGDLIAPWTDTRELSVSGTAWTPDEVRLSGRVLRARPGLTPGGNALDVLTSGMSPQAQARSVRSLSAFQWAAALDTMATRGDDVGPLLAEAVRVAETFPDASVPHEDGFVGALFDAWSDDRFADVPIREKDALAVEMLNLALGTCPVGFGLAGDRQDEVRRFDGALAFLSVCQDPDERHYYVEEVRDALAESGAALLTQDDEDAAVYAAITALADPDKREASEVLNGVESACAAFLPQEDASLIRRAVETYLAKETAPQPAEW